MEEAELMKEKRGNIIRELKSLAEISNVEAELQDVTIFKLMTVFEKVIKRFEAEKNKPVHQVIQYPYTIENQKKYVVDELSKKERLSFVELLQAFPSRIGVIFNFLAILEMLAIQQISIQIGEGFNNFWVTKAETSEVNSVSGEW